MLAGPWSSDASVSHARPRFFPAEAQAGRAVLTCCRSGFQVAATPSSAFEVADVRRMGGSCMAGMGREMTFLGLQL